MSAPMPMAAAASLTPEAAALRIDLVIRSIHRLPLATFEAQAEVLADVIDQLQLLKRRILGAE